MGRSEAEIDLDELERLTRRYDGTGPRYTSYPTAPVWSEDIEADFLETELAQLGPRPGLSLYVHVPFCRSLCHFCACNRVITRDASLPERFLDTIGREVDQIRARLDGGTTQQLHWGGGTPTHLTPEQTIRLHGLLDEAFPAESDAERSIEVDPRVTSEEHVAALHQCGFERISMGVQDTDPRVQEAIHRIQPVERTGELVAQARSHGFRSVGFDLIYGLPFQDLESFGRTLDAVLELAPDRVALYGYAHVTWKAKQQRGFERHDLPDAGTRLALFLEATRRFLAAGYVAIGMDHFARPDDDLARALSDGRLHRNFMGYTTRAGGALLGFGPSAISELPTAYAQSERELEPWGAAIDAGRLATIRGHRLSADDRARKLVIGQLLCRFHVEANGEFASRFAPELAALTPLAEDGLVELGPGGEIQVTALGRLFIRRIAMVFDAYLPAQQRSDQPIFSRVV